MKSRNRYKYVTYHQEPFSRSHAKILPHSEPHFMKLPHTLSARWLFTLIMYLLRKCKSFSPTTSLDLRLLLPIFLNLTSKMHSSRRSYSVMSALPCGFFFFPDSVVIWQISDAYFPSVYCSEGVSVPCLSEMSFFLRRDEEHFKLFPNLCSGHNSAISGLYGTRFALPRQFLLLHNNNKHRACAGSWVCQSMSWDVDTHSAPVVSCNVCYCRRSWEAWCWADLLPLVHNLLSLCGSLLILSSLVKWGTFLGYVCLVFFPNLPSPQWALSVWKTQGAFTPESCFLIVFPLLWLLHLHPPCFILFHGFRFHS